MSKRIIRIAGNKMRPFLDGLIGLMVNIVLENGLTFFGQLTAITSLGITITDTRAHLHFFEDKDIYEVLYDQIEIKNSYK